MMTFFLFRNASLGLLALLLGSTANAQEGKSVLVAPGHKGAARDVITEAELRKNVQNATPFLAAMASAAKPLGASRPSLESTLWDTSLLLFDGEVFTIVPAGSILRMPVTLQSKLIEKPQGGFVLWPEFLKRNATWLAAKEVPLKMSKGDAATAEKVLREVATDPRVLVAVYKGGPIMIMEQQKETADDAKAATNGERKTRP